MEVAPFFGFELICDFLAKHALLPFCESLIVEALKTRRQMRIRLSNGSAPGPSEALVKVVERLLAMHIRGGSVRVFWLKKIKRADLSTLKVLVAAELFTICRWR